jgi:hypothetical protein
MLAVFRDAGAMATCSALGKHRGCFTLGKECTIGSLLQEADQ